MSEVHTIDHRADYSAERECPKCGAHAFSTRYVPKKHHQPLMSIYTWKPGAPEPPIYVYPERLVVTCLRCGWSLDTKPKDQATAPAAVTYPTDENGGAL